MTPTITRTRSRRPIRTPETDGVLDLSVDLPLEYGGRLDDVRIAYCLTGRSGAPVVAVLGGISAGRHVAGSGPDEGWWSRMVGRGRPIDLDRYRVLSFDYLVGVGKTEQRPAVDGRKHGAPEDAAAGSPLVTPRDQSDVLATLVDCLEVGALHGFVGASYGGAVALAFAARHPERTRGALVIGAAHRSHPLATALRTVQRRIVERGVTSGDERGGLALARSLAMITYRSDVEFEERFAGSPALDDGAPRFPVEGYLDHHGSTFARRFTASAFLGLSLSLDLHAVDPAAVEAPVTLVSISPDTLAPRWQLEELEPRLTGRSRLVRVESRYGHDAFLADHEAFAPVVADFLANPGLGSEMERAAETDRSGRRSSSRPLASRGRATPPAAIAAPGRGASTGLPGQVATTRCRGRPATTAVRTGIGVDEEWGAVVPPIHLTSTFTFEGFGVQRRYDYTRSGNPTRDLLAEAVANLEGGAGAAITSSGMSAVTLVLHLLEPGDLLLAPHDCYGGTMRLIDALAGKARLRVRYVDQTDPEALAAAFEERPAMCWVETPSNPLLRIVDLREVRDRCSAAGTLFVADNTFLSPALQRPIEHGADVVVHSTTKYLNGHSDVVGGAVVAADPALHEELVWWANCLGLPGAPFDSFLTLRGIRTLHPRMAAHERNARSVVDLLAASRVVRAVHYPGLPHHPGHEVAARQQSGFGAIVSFELEGGTESVEAFLDGLRHLSLAESLGGVESLVAHPVTMTHASMDPDARRRAGISDSLLRLSVGIEDDQDLRADVLRGLERVEGRGRRG